jgi:hypothetical protein
MPIIAGRASAAYGAGFGAITGPPPFDDFLGSYDALASVTLSSSASTITFSGIPNNYKHLQIRILSQTTRSTYNVDSFGIAINGVGTGTLYSRHQLVSNNGGTSAVNSFNQPGTPSVNPFIDTTTSNAGANVFGSSIIDILDYASTTKYPVIRAIGGGDTNGIVSSFCGTVGLSSALYAVAGPINSFSMFVTYGTTFNAKTTASIYGVR